MKLVYIFAIILSAKAGIAANKACQWLGLPGPDECFYAGQRVQVTVIPVNGTELGLKMANTKDLIVELDDPWHTDEYFYNVEIEHPEENKYVFNMNVPIVDNNSNTSYIQITQKLLHLIRKKRCESPYFCVKVASEHTYISEPTNNPESNRTAIQIENQNEKVEQDKEKLNENLDKLKAE